MAKLVYNEIPSLLSENCCPTETTDYFDYLLELMNRNGRPICFLDLEAPLDRIDKVLSQLENWLLDYGTEHGDGCENCAEVQDKFQKIMDKRPRVLGLCLGCFEENTCPEHKK